MKDRRRVFGFLSAQHPGRIILTAFALGAVVYVTMILGPLAELEQIAGAKPFDLRPGGYSYDSAQAFIASLGADGRELYLWRQIPLDTAYPALFAISIAGAIRWLSRKLGRPLQRWFGVLSWTACLAALSDYLENALIVAMLNSGEGLSPALVNSASMATVSKSALTSAALAALLVALIIFGARKMKPSRKPD